MVTGPAVYLPNSGARPRSVASKKTAAFFASSRGLMEALDRDFSFSQFLMEQGAPCTQDDGFYGVSDSMELLAWQKAMNQNQLLRLAQQGVRIWDLDSCYVSPWTTIGRGTELLPGVMLTGCNSVGSGCTIGPDTYLSDCSVADGARVMSSRGEHAVIGPDCEVGPFANLRPGTRLGPAVKAGAFVEMKEARVGARTQVAHLAYLGDATLGQDCNIGCGVATANFDRVDKHETVLEDSAFVGCTPVWWLLSGWGRARTLLPGPSSPRTCRPGPWAWPAAARPIRKSGQTATKSRVFRFFRIPDMKN